MTAPGPGITPATDPAPEEPVPAPEAVRPSTGSTPAAWVRTNLFRTWTDAILTVVVGGLLAYLAFRFLRFVLVTGQWEVVGRNLTTFLVGRFDRAELWRPSASLAIGAFGIGLLVGLAGPTGRRRPAEAARSIIARTWPLLLLIVVLLNLAESAGPALLVVLDVVAVVVGRSIGHRLRAGARRIAFVVVALVPVAMVTVISGFGGVPWDRWGGLLLNLFLAAFGISLCFPLGVLLALGRRSTLPVARALSVAYIELVRGVPLVALLLMGALTLGFFLPESINPGLFVRVVAVLTIFTAAYVAEIVRGGLQSVPSGQAEAATAIGLSPTKITALIVLPQALRASIPALVGQFISLFKDTSLVSVVSITELLRVAQVVTQQGDFRGQGLLTETLVFAMFVFWVGAFTMSRESQRLERRYGVGER